MLEATRKGDIRIVPETWKKTWFNWLENIQPWCVSRQLWWGHRIPAWYGRGGRRTSFVAEIAKAVATESSELAKRTARATGNDVCQRCLPGRGRARHLVLIGACGRSRRSAGPSETEDLKRHYPNDVLISGFDILFFWDARMAMQGIEFMGEPPWKTLYLHGLVRDAHGQKMSKSKGNTVDPLGLIDKYGADALRFTLAAMESQGRDIKLDEKRVEGYRNFATKLWNAARFLQMNGVGASDSIAAPDAELPVNRWIIGEVVETLAKLDSAFDELRYDEMADAIYHFVWGTFCDWYVELVKGAFDDETKARRRLGVRPDPGDAPPADAVHHRGIVGRDGRAPVRADRRQMAGARRRRSIRMRQGRDRVADRLRRAKPRAMRDRAERPRGARRSNRFARSAPRDDQARRLDGTHAACWRSMAKLRSADCRSPRRRRLGADRGR